ncbi:MAG: methyltransferase domain-containing protein [Proteobacteria bacterium]|nr:methyltransferase domain-containing protein [Pseudomonadota bacterium]
MKIDQKKWDERYSKMELSTDPSDVVVEYSGLARRGRALDIAAGNGRNSFFLADRGFKVDAVDISEVALRKIREKNVIINTIHEDLDFYQLDVDTYDLIVNVNYLQRRLFPYIKDALTDRGILVFQTFLYDQTQGRNNGHNKKDHYLRKNELLHGFLSLKIIYFREEEITVFTGEKRGAATLVASKM